MITEHQTNLFPEQSTESEPPPDTYPAAFLARSPDSPILNRVTISGLKGFDDCSIFLRPLTLLTGPNNSGKSTVLQAIALGFECFRRCLSTSNWSLQSAGRAVTEFEFLPVNEPRELWFRKTWKPSVKQERYVRVTLSFLDGFEFSARLRFLYGGINIGVEVVGGTPTPDVLKRVAASAPVLVPATPGPGSHEDYYPLAQIHRFLSMREPSRIMRNVLLRLAETADRSGFNFVNSVMKKYFNVSLQAIRFDETRDLEVRAPLQASGDEFSLDIVSAGSGLNQILMLAAVLAWRRPGIVLLDEPDAHLHSSVQAQLLDFLTDLSTQFRIQIIAATHSRDLISRAPLESIVPVDRTRAELHPLQDLGHLLLEFERHGSVNNVDLALLYQTRRCLFVEGPKDVSMLPRVAERLGFDMFAGRQQVVPFELGGVAKVRLVPQMVSLFERLVGAKLRWGVVRDSDANIPEVKEAIMKEANKLGFPTFHLWNRYSIENYLLEPYLLVKAIDKVAGSGKVAIADIEVLLGRAIADIEKDVDGSFITHAQNAFREIMGALDWYDQGAAAAAEYIKSLDTPEKRLHAYPGRRIFGKLVQSLQEKHKLHIRIDDVIAILDNANAPKELVECMEKVAGI